MVGSAAILHITPPTEEIQDPPPFQTTLENPTEGAPLLSPQWDPVVDSSGWPNFTPCKVGGLATLDSSRSPDPGPAMSPPGAHPLPHYSQAPKALGSNSAPPPSLSPFLTFCNFFQVSFPVGFCIFLPRPYQPMTHFLSISSLFSISSLCVL